MNRKEDLLAMLLAILREKHSVLHGHAPVRYYNELLDGASSVLAALLGTLLREQDEEWMGAKWMDDSLLTQVWAVLLPNYPSTQFPHSSA